MKEALIVETECRKFNHRWVPPAIMHELFLIFSQDLSASWPNSDDVPNYETSASRVAALDLMALMLDLT